ncbi:DUF485 domain-containing protein [Oryzomicrobium sp.]|uniref:DUF485 domain-containing protein n=1 Tax=Oryzomicrobium sp. TaxID=1911578 RepID=UPI0025D74399|nr:DUF485 domain-containing protein [Oryzomicrobium sp.]MCE1176780.1 DUF485 domain-containing protein [Burkholderiales bacterium]MCE1244821.1 DUF485 domain-containing protein [Oryzomicrobium sp.]
MRDDLVAKIQANPKYHQLKSKRNAFGWVLTVIMLIAYYGYVGVIAFDKELFAQRVGEGVTTLGIPVGFGLIVFTIAITIYYVRRANAEFDSLTDEILKEVK